MEVKPQRKFIKENFNVRQGVTRRPISRHLYFPTKAALLLSQSPTKLNAIEKEVVNNLCTAAPDIKQACTLSRQFRNLLILKRGKLTKRFDNWLKLALKCKASEIRSFAKGLMSDFAAVHNAILSKLSITVILGQAKRRIWGQA